MKISRIEIQNFRAFNGLYAIELPEPCTNLLVYGENGSGKTSLYLALKYFLDSDLKALNFAHYKNVFGNEKTGYIKCNIGNYKTTESHSFVWSETECTTYNTLITNAARTKLLNAVARLMG